MEYLRLEVVISGKLARTRALYSNTVGSTQYVRSLHNVVQNFAAVYKDDTVMCKVD